MDTVYGLLLALVLLALWLAVSAVRMAIWLPRRAQLIAQAACASPRSALPWLRGQSSSTTSPVTVRRSAPTGAARATTSHDAVMPVHTLDVLNGRNSGV